MTTETRDPFAEANADAAASLDEDRARPLVLVDITDGVEQSRFTYGGLGAPILEVQDFDDEGRDPDDLEWLAERADLFARLIRERLEDIAAHVDLADTLEAADADAAAAYERDADKYRAAADFHRAAMASHAAR